MDKLFEKLSDATARLEQVICIAGALGDGMAMADPLRELLDEDDDTLTKCFGKMPDWLTEALGDRHEAADAFFQWATDTAHLGFAIQIATPVMTPHGKGSASYSWGYYSTRWVYADTFDSAVDAGIAWVEDCRKKEKLKAKNKTPNANVCGLPHGKD